MDYLEKYEAKQEARREAIASTAAVGSAALADGKKTDMPETDYPVTIIGCIRGMDGWYEAGYDKRSKTIKPMQALDSSSPLLRERTLQAVETQSAQLTLADNQETKHER